MPASGILLHAGSCRSGRLDLSFAKKMVFPDPFACMLFQLERMEDLGSAHWFRQTARRHGCSLEEARGIAADEIFGRTVIFGLGTTGMFIGDVHGFYRFGALPDLPFIHHMAE